MKRLIAIILLIFPLTLISQSELGVSLNGGVSKLLEGDDSYFRPSFYTSIYHRIKVDKVRYLGSEFSIMQIEGKQEYYENVWNGEEHIRNYYDYLSHSTYLGLSFMLGLDIYKFTLEFRVQVSYLMINKGEEKNKKKYDGTSIVDDSKSYTNFLDSNYDAGLRVALAYRISNSFGVEGSFYMGIIQQHSYVGAQVFGNNQQICIGIKYSFWSLD